MHTHSTFNSPSRQRGLALVILIVVIALAYISYFFSGLSIPGIKYEQDVKTMAALKKAKQALLAYAMNYPDRFPLPLPPITQGPGNFPCPALLDGVQVTFGAIGPGSPCNPVLAAPGAIGRYPWKTLETGELYDGSGELLWYAISKNYAAVANGEINTSTVGQITIKNRDGSLRVDGNSNDAIIAVIIAPGEALVRDDGVVQSRTTAAERLDAINYLDIAFSGGAFEEDNADYINENANDGFMPGPIFNAANVVIVNDLMVVITYSEIMELVHARVGQELSDVINDYFTKCGAYPDAAIFNPVIAGPYDSVLGLSEGMLPVDEAKPLDWDMDNNPDCDLTGVKFPDWVVAEEWHLHTYYRHTYTNPVFPAPPPPAVGTPCGVGTCLTVTGMPAPDNNKEVMLMFAGRALDENLGLVPPLNDQFRPSVDLNDYFEADNNDGGLTFDLTPYDTEVPEDYIRVVAP